MSPIPFRQRRPRCAFFPLLAIAWSSATLAAQCANVWQATPAVPGTDAFVQASIEWDSDGPGPRSPVVVLGGEFHLAGGVATRGIVTYDPATGVWAELGGGIQGRVSALLVLPNGDLVAGGPFTVAGSGAAYSIARWDGTAWSPFGAGLDQISFPFEAVTSLAVLPNGDLIAGGGFASVDGVSAVNIARWDGTTWAALGTGLGARVRTLSRASNGELLAGGEFVSAGGVAANRVARWNGTAWSAIGSGLDAAVLTAVPRANGDIVAGGLFRSAGGRIALHVARWNGMAWNNLQDGIAGSQVHAAMALPNGDVVVGGAFAVSGVPGTPNVARWDGASWSPLGAGTDAAVHALVQLPNGDLVAGGDFLLAGGVAVGRVARWNGTTWSSIGANLQQLVRALAVLPNGDLVVGGAFAGGVVRWDGTTWSTLGGGVAGEVRALAVLPNGDLVAAGSFPTAGGVPANGVARWDGASWSSFAAGVFASGSGGEVRALAVLPNGDLVCGGNLPGYVTQWNGTGWSWSGSAPDHAVETLAVLPDGDLLVSGWFSFVGGLAARGLARWDGAAWSPMDWAYPHWPAAAIAALPNGELVLGSSPPDGCFVRRLASTCPALAVVAGGGCAGAGGPNVLSARSLPWIGSVHRTEATGMPANGFAFVVLGLGSAAIPLATLSPQGGPGCDLHVALELFETRAIVAGRVQVAIAVPDAMALVGLQVLQQVLPVELDLAGNVVEFTASNALALTIGVF